MPRFYIDLQSLKVVDRPEVGEPIETVSFKRGTGPLIEVQFIRDGIPELLPAGNVLRWGTKEATKYDGVFITFVSGFTIPATSAGYYAATANFNTTELNGLLLSPDGNPLNDVASVDLGSEFSWRIGAAAPVKSATLTVHFDNSYDNGNEAAVTSAGPDLSGRIAALEGMPLLIVGGDFVTALVGQRILSGGTFV